MVKHTKGGKHQGSVVTKFTKQQQVGSLGVKEKEVLSVKHEGQELEC